MGNNSTHDIGQVAAWLDLKVLDVSLLYVDLNGEWLEVEILAAILRQAGFQHLAVTIMQHMDTAPDGTWSMSIGRRHGVGASMFAASMGCFSLAQGHLH